VEWFFVLVLVVILFGPIVWAVTKGRRSRAPDHEDAKGLTAYGKAIGSVEASRGQGPLSSLGC
jgi:hypothetical protein